MRDRKSSRRDFFYAVVLAAVVCAGLAAAATAVSKRTGISDAIEGGQLAKVAIPKMTEKLNRIDINMARLAGAVDALTGGRAVTLATTQDESRVCDK